MALRVLHVVDVRTRGLVAQAGFPRERIALAAEHQVGIQALLVDDRRHAAVQVIVDRERGNLARRIGLPLVGDQLAFALLGAVVHAELHLGVAGRARVCQLEAGFGVLGGGGFRGVHGLLPLGAVDAPGVVEVAAGALEQLLALGGGLRVLEARMVHAHLGATAGHVEFVLGADAVVLLVVRVQAGDTDVLGLALFELLLERHLADVALGLHVEAVDAELRAVADIDRIRQVARVVAAVLDLRLVFPADLVCEVGAAVVLEAVGALFLAAVAVLHVDAGQHAATQGLERGHRAEGGVGLAVVPAIDAQAQVAAVELVGIAQHDVDRAGHGVAAAVGAGAALDLDVVDHLRRDAVDVERAVVAGARHLLAVDQHLGVAAAQAAQLGAVVFHDVGADEGDARHALEHVADGVGLEALEVLEVVGQDRRGGVGAVAVGDLALHDDAVQFLWCRFRVLGAIGGLGLRQRLPGGQQREAQQGA